VQHVELLEQLDQAAFAEGVLSGCLEGDAGEGLLQVTDPFLSD